MLLALVLTLSLRQFPMDKPHPDDGEAIRSFRRNLRAVAVPYRPIFIAIVHRDYSALIGMAQPRVRFAVYDRLYPANDKYSPSLGEGAIGFSMEWNVVARRRLQTDLKPRFREMIECIRKGFSRVYLVHPPWWPGAYADNAAGISEYGYHLKCAAGSYVTLLIRKHDTKHPIAGFIDNDK